MKVGVVDPLSPGGHISLNQFLLDSLGDSLDCLVVSDEISRKIQADSTRKNFAAGPLKRGRLLHAVYSFYVTIVTILMLGEYGQTHLVFAGLIIFSLPIMDTTLAILF